MPPASDANSLLDANGLVEPAPQALIDFVRAIARAAAERDWVTALTQLKEKEQQSVETRPAERGQ